MGGNSVSGEPDRSHAHSRSVLRRICMHKMSFASSKANFNRIVAASSGTFRAFTRVSEAFQFDCHKGYVRKRLTECDFARRCGDT